jgi:hypothetical protein
MLATSISGPCITSGRLSLEADEGASGTGTGSCGTNESLDVSGHQLRILVLPGSQDLPAGFPELRVGLSVSALVGLDLLAPEVGVTGGPGRVLGAAVPEAAIDEDCHSRRDESDVYAAAFVE